MDERAVEGVGKGGGESSGQEIDVELQVAGGVEPVHGQGSALAIGGAEQIERDGPGRRVVEAIGASWLIPMERMTGSAAGGSIERFRGDDFSGKQSKVQFEAVEVVAAEGGEENPANVEIMPGDTITVPRAPVIYVVGDVGRPSGLLVDNGTLTVLQALALAGGTNKTAKLGASRIIRKGPDGGVTETKVEIKKMLEAKIPDMPLEADDILFVPVSGRRVFAARTFEATMTMATAMALYTVHP